MLQSLVFDVLPHLSSVIDSEHDFGDLLLLDIACHVGEPSNPIHANVVGLERIMHLKHAVELSLVDVLANITVFFELLLKSGNTFLLDLLEEPHESFVIHWIVNLLDNLATGRLIVRVVQSSHEGLT